jgi:preprotein translocase subunit Sss1
MEFAIINKEYMHKITFRKKKKAKKDQEEFEKIVKIHAINPFH